MIKKVIFFFIICYVSFAQTEDMKIGVALSGGGARGFVHIGFLKVIDEVGLKIDCISGTSFGALIGSMYSLGYSAKEIEEIFLKHDYDKLLDDTVYREDQSMYSKRWLDYYFSSLAINEKFEVDIPMSFLGGNNLLHSLVQNLSASIYYDSFDDFPIPFRCVGTNLETGEETIFHDGYLIDAVRASMAFPGALEPFEVDGNLYVDGGVRNNLPVNAILDMGADYIISNKANTPLRDKENCKDMLEILNQTVNINMELWVKDAEENSDLVIAPEIDNYKSTDFKEVKQLIKLGEEEARKHIKLFQKLASNQKKHQEKVHSRYLPKKMLIEKIYCSNNDRYYDSEIKTYSLLKSNRRYSLDEIISGSQRCFNTKHFSWVYPKIHYNNGHYTLELKVKEKPVTTLDIGFSYTHEKNITFSFSNTLDNYLQKKSKLITNVRIGASNAIATDYVKNWGERYGVYYRAFINISENSLYDVNYDNKIANKTKLFDYGTTLGTGFFLNDIFVGEFYVFSSKKSIYQDIAELNLPYHKFENYGFGFKLYRETVDDLYLPTRGCVVYFKARHSYDDYLFESSSDRYNGEFSFAIPLSDRFSIIGKTEGGYIKNSEYSKIFEPFEIGGVDSFISDKPHSVSEDAYQCNEIGIRYNIEKKHFVTFRFQEIVTGGYKQFYEMRNPYRSFDISYGYKSLLGPLRTYISCDENFNFNYGFAIGFTKDMFKFSRP